MGNSFLTKALHIKFALMQGVYWCAFASFTSFAVAFFQQERGISAGTIGVFLTVYTLFSFLGSFFWTYLCDRFKTHKVILIITALLSVLTVFLLYISQSLMVMMVLYAMLGFVQNSIPANLDTWILKTYHDRPAMYGPIRSIGSIGYAVFMLVYGGVIDARGFIVMPIFMGIFIAALVILTVVTKDAPVLEREIQTKSNTDTKANSKLFTVSFVSILVVLFCMGMGLATYQVVAMIIDRAHGTMVHVGYACFMSGLIQFFFFVGGKWLIKIKAKYRFITAAVLNIIFMLMLTFIQTPIAVIIACGVSGAFFSLFLLTVRETIQNNAPADKSTSAQGIADAVLNYLAGICNSLIIAGFSDKMGLTFVLIVFTVIVISGFAIVLVNKKIKYEA